ncbi:MAG: Rieske 2Fe-2S domain-containing protein [Acetobacteraceae bacterium]|jgi:anthranilate 1,2-dioxygenase large subunit/terephthalate 1,2-dioxygenase oxygenase component alpha subunit
MPDDAAVQIRSHRFWPGGLTRVPFWAYQDPDILGLEQRRLFEGPVWNYLCLESEIPHEGDWRTTYVGTMPIVVVRDQDGSIVAFENRCAHRGALICLDDGGNAKEFHCVYHAWRYDLRGNLRSIAFQRGVNGKGGMPADFRMADHGPRKLRTSVLFGIVFGTLSDATPDIETFAGPEVIDRLQTAAGGRKLEIIGRFTEVLPNNWKLYAENVRDTYHASLLHLFFATFKLNRLSQGGGTQINDTGSCHVSTTLAPDQAVDHAYNGMRSVDDDFRLNDPSLLDAVDEHGDRVRQQIISVFPTFVMQRTQNVMAVRHFLPRGSDTTDLHWIFLGYADDTQELRKRRLRQLNLAGPAGYVSMEDGCIGGFVERGAAAARDQTSILEMGGAEAKGQDTRATEAAIRGFWQFWRGLLDI